MVNCLERCDTDGDMKGGVIPIFGSKNPLRPLAGVGTHKAAKIGLQTSINDFRLAIRLRVISCAAIQ